MKLVVDLQGAQSLSSRNRGIGRYSLALAQAMARRSGSHDLWIALNSTISPSNTSAIRAAFKDDLSEERLIMWDALAPAYDVDPANEWRRRTGELVRESFLASLKPDMVHVSSLFEGLGENAVTSIGAFADGSSTAVTVYDLIPLIHHDRYLVGARDRIWYERKLTSCRRAGLWLAISEASRKEAIDYLNLPDEKVVNISAAADPVFRPLRLTSNEENRIRHLYGLTRPFVMYTGGFDPRKNIEKLIKAYSQLPTGVRGAHQLAIVCTVSEEIAQLIRAYAKSQSLAPDELILTGFVPDSDLISLYNMCAGFCFPSWHEGFGMPALEAMQCGAPTIGANISSISEIIGRGDALFDPHNEGDIARRLQQLLTDGDYRRALVVHGLDRSKKFSWDETARRAWCALEAHCQDRVDKDRRIAASGSSKRPRLAFISPLPPECSGIAQYSAELLPELARHYDIDVIVDQPEVSDPWVKANCPIRTPVWFKQHAQIFDRILYHFGNSDFHKYMFDLVVEHPGVVVLHDFYLSGVAAHLELWRGWSGFWTMALYHSHGYKALKERTKTPDALPIINTYPANYTVLRSAHGIIVHSDYSRRLANHFYGENFAADWTIIPAIRGLPQKGGRNEARKMLGFDEKDFVVCSFGILHANKACVRLLKAWLGSNFAQDANAHLIFVGYADDASGSEASDLRKIITGSPAGARIRLTSFVSSEAYQHYLWAADVAVQLRTFSRGETSRTVLDCMAYGLPTIVNAHGPMADLPEDSVILLPDEFSESELIAAIEDARNPVKQKTLRGHARDFVRECASPRRAADLYQAAIEDFFSHSRGALRARLLAALDAVEPKDANEHEWLALACVINRNLPTANPQRQLLVDISSIMDAKSKSLAPSVEAKLIRLLDDPPKGFRVEPIYRTDLGYRYARRYMAGLLSFEPVLDDAPISISERDEFCDLRTLRADPSYSLEAGFGSTVSPF